MRIENTPRVLMMLFLPAVTVAGVLFYFSGSLTIPKHSFVISNADDHGLQPGSAVCFDETAYGRKREVDAGIDANRFSILSWNAHKGRVKDWYRDFEAFGENVDFILLQEAALDLVLKSHLQRVSEQWLLAVAFRLRSRDIGILTAGVIPALSYCSLREQEPFIRIPKIALAGIYPIKGVKENLLIINVHLVNFTIGSDVMRRQLKAIMKIVTGHRGPVIVAGDFNTWNGVRESVVHDELTSLGLLPVVFDPDNRAEFFDRKLDGVYYRGLEVTKSLSYQVNTSDHNPLEVHFRLATRER